MKQWYYEQLAMYAAYHRDKRNQLTHHIGVPMIVFSLMLLLSPVDLIALDGGTVTLSMLLVSVLLLTYVVAFPLVGMIAVAIYGSLLYLAHWIEAMDTISTTMLGLGLFVVGWAIQFTGHIFEGRKPALFDNLMQVFVAPAFLIAEVLFIFKLEGRLKNEIESRMDKYLPE